MVSAQCLFESTKGCRRQEEAVTNHKKVTGYKGNMVDRLGKSFYVQTNCDACYNIIYNGQALALHKQAEEIFRLKPRNIRLDFTKETKNEMKQVLKIFVDRFRYNRMNPDELQDYTTGHFKRGVD
jgi:putative protease